MALDMGKMSLGTQIVVFLVLAAAIYGAFYYFVYTGLEAEIETKTHRAKRTARRGRERESDCGSTS